jgi:hypothetical protein
MSMSPNFGEGVREQGKQSIGKRNNSFNFEEVLARAKMMAQDRKNRGGDYLSGEPEAKNRGDQDE